jgi:hypothetical protein
MAFSLTQVLHRPRQMHMLHRDTHGTVTVLRMELFAGDVMPHFAD